MIRRGWRERQLLFAGNETTAKWLGHIVATLGQQPEVREELASQPSLIPAALEEVMRWQGVTQVLPRSVKKDDFVIEGVALPRGAEVLLLLGAAGRDPERYDDPDRFDIHREPRPHLAFGFGLHSCLGAVLARMEAYEVTHLLLERLPRFSVRSPIQYGNFSLRGPATLRIALASA